MKTMKTTPLVFVLCLLLAGCQMENSQSHIKPQKINAQSSETKSSTADEADRLGLCQQQLEALQKIDTAKYGVYQQRFDTLMNSAAEYAGVRTNVNVDSQDTLDALYHYRVNLFCSEINQVLLTGLAERGIK
uniref:Putative exported protein n=1 Tax=Yersinia enterocolitica TaxID=630 RepID=F2Q860_YEREN|nr:putative exported protein [Yersinia enterocolitica]